MADEISLDMEDLREVAAYAAENAADVLEIFERSYPADFRPRDAVEAARTFAQGGKRVKALRDAAWAALKAAKEAEDAAASQAARAAMSASSAAYLHPLARSTQVRHILGALTTRPGPSNLQRLGIPGRRRLCRARGPSRDAKARRGPAALSGSTARRRAGR